MVAPLVISCVSAFLPLLEIFSRYAEERPQALLNLRHAIRSVCFFE